MGSLNDYNILQVIGKGSYGEVHLIQHKKEKKQYVIKKLALLKASKRERKAAELEAKLLSKLRHPNIVSYKDSFEGEDGFLYIVMGFAEGGDLYTKLREHRDNRDYLSEVQVVRWFIQICMAIQYLHQRHILHRDLKTQNIFLTKTKMIKVGDLGIAKVLEGSTDMATTLIGTPYYMSPELFSNKPYNYKSDIWALGCCVFEIMTLRHAFNAKDMNSLVYKILQRKIPKLPDLYSVELCELIKSMLNQQADKRPSVNKILRNSFIKHHIQLFLDESSKRGSARNGARQPRTSNTTTATAASHSSVKSSSSTDVTTTAASSTASSSSSKHHQQQQQQSEKQTPNTSVGRQQHTSTMENANNNNNDRPLPRRDAGDATGASVGGAGQSRENRKQQYPLINNGRGDHANRLNHHHQQQQRGHRATGDASRKPEAVTQRRADVVIAKKPASQKRNVISSSSSSATAAVSASRPLASSATPTVTSSRLNKEEHNGGSELTSSGESVASNVSRTSSSARERRRQRHNRINKKTEKSSPPISTSSNVFPLDGAGDQKPKATTATNEKRAAVRSPDSDESGSSGGGGKQDNNKKEEEKFYNLLSTTLKMEEDDEDDTSHGDELPAPGDAKRLSPVPELSESQASSVIISQQQQPSVEKPNTPQATKVRFPSNLNASNNNNKPGEKVDGDVKLPMKSKLISQGTLASTGRLMDRIVALRKDCIRGLGVQLLHRAYELLDEEKDEDRLQDQLVTLLGKARFYQWAGKIWQLKFCEESIFNHCGSISAI